MLPLVAPEPQIGARGGIANGGGFAVTSVLYRRPPAFHPHRHASESWHLVRQAISYRHGGRVDLYHGKPRGMLYVGVTAYLAERVDQHRRDKGSAYCRKYGIKLLVLAEQHDRIEDAIAREKALKTWKRAWKIELIEQLNPGWDDLFDRIA